MTLKHRGSVPRSWSQRHPPWQGPQLLEKDWVPGGAGERKRAWDSLHTWGSAGKKGGVCYKDAGDACRGSHWPQLGQSEHHKTLSIEWIMKHENINPWAYPINNRWTQAPYTHTERKGPCLQQSTGCRLAARDRGRGAESENRSSAIILGKTGLGKNYEWLLNLGEVWMKSRIICLI